MNLTRLLIANRGEVAVRVASAAASLGIETVAIFCEDDSESLHIRKADLAAPLEGSGPAAYLDMQQILDVAEAKGCDAVHPGYGFLSENPEFARRCSDSSLIFVGPTPEQLTIFGNKVEARRLAQTNGVPVVRGTVGATTLDQAREFLASMRDGNGIMIKAVAGGGGRGMRAVHSADMLEEAYNRCRSEAAASCGNGDVYVEQLVRRARHIEIQVVGDAYGECSHLGERECSIQRRNQKIIEIAPSPSLSPGLRQLLIDASLRLARSVDYKSLGTFEFLVDQEKRDGEDCFSFIEANARLQVEHTVTEEVTGIDLVRSQLQIAAGARLNDIALSQDDIPSARGFAIQARINMETMGSNGIIRPTGGTLTAFEVPSGPGLRIDSFGYGGYTTNVRFDSLLAKLIAHSASKEFRQVLSKTYRALCEFKIEGVTTNISFLQNLLQHDDVINNQVYTSFIEEHLEELTQDTKHRGLFFEGKDAAPENNLAGVKVDNIDPLAVLKHGISGESGDNVSVPSEGENLQITGPEGTLAVLAPLQGTIVSVEAKPGDRVSVGQQLMVMESMKMEHVICADIAGQIHDVTVYKGDAVFEGHVLAFVEEMETGIITTDQNEGLDLDYIRPDLAEIIERHELGQDSARPEAVARRRKTGQRTARENVYDICDKDSYVEYGPMIIAAQRQRRSLDDLIRRTPADGMIAGVGSVNGQMFDEKAAQCIVISYDYTVLAGTQGFKNHYKKDRMFELADRWKIPVVFFAEGGGGRPGDTDWSSPSGLDVPAFYLWGKLSGLVPLIGITSGRCFAGNAVILGCCDVVIATKGSNIGMGGPAMIEGGGTRGVQTGGSGSYEGSGS